MAGYDIKVVYYFKIPPVKFDNNNILKIMDKYCPQPRTWLISPTPGDSTPLGASTIQTLLSFTGTSSPIKVEIINLTGNAVGSTQNTTMSLVVFSGYQRSTHAASFSFKSQSA